MPMQEKQNELTRFAAPGPEPAAEREHCLTMRDRRELIITGVRRILSYDENGAALTTPLGNLTIGGQGLQVSELSVHTGQVHICGQIEFLQYTENRESSGGFFARLMR